MQPTHLEVCCMTQHELRRKYPTYNAAHADEYVEYEEIPAVKTVELPAQKPTPATENTVSVSEIVGVTVGVAVGIAGVTVGVAVGIVGAVVSAFIPGKPTAQPPQHGRRRVTITEETIIHRKTITYEE